MQTSQIQERFSTIERCVDQAAILCRTNHAVPDELRECLTDLERESDEAKQIAQSETDDERIRQCADKLEELGNRAMQACKHAANVDPHVQNAVSQAHDAISSLKHQLH